MAYLRYSLALLILLHAVLAHSDAALPEPRVKKLNEQVYALLGPIGFPDAANQGYMVNSAVLIGDEGVVLVDTGFTHEIGEHLKASIAKLTDKPVTHIINTHDHGDHVLGNSAFPNAEIISSQKCRELVQQRGYEWIATVEQMTGRTFPDTKPVPADTVYAANSRTGVTLQGIPMELWVPAGSHTPGDLMVYLPQDKILIAGDILVKEMMPSFRDADAGNWIETLQQISQIDIKTAIPGHGPLMDLEEIKAMHKRVAKLYAGIEAGYKKGLMDSEIRKTLDLSEWKEMVEFEGLMGTAISRIYLEVERENF